VADSHTWHAAMPRDKREELMTLWDVIAGIAGGAAVMALPFLVTVPGMIALLGLCIAVLLPLAALGLALAVLSAPAVALWWLVRLVRR
jgi:VIT1/CCC1 family predicted Fe2+/Mn2+ transporter